MSLENPQTLLDNAPGLPKTSTAGSQGRLRASMACAACRVRKCRCDGDRPTCSKCKVMKTECSYDVEVRRRGPDKVPGGRQLALLARRNAGSLLFARPTQIKPYTHKPKGSAFTSKPIKPHKVENSDGIENAKLDLHGFLPYTAPEQPAGTGPPSRSSTYLGSAPLVNNIQNVDLLFNGGITEAISPPWSDTSADQHIDQDFSPHTQLLEPITVSPSSVSNATPHSVTPITVYEEDIKEYQPTELVQHGNITPPYSPVMAPKGFDPRLTIMATPSSDFIRKSWWDNLLGMYGTDRATSFRIICEELISYFRDAYLCVQMHNTSLFLATLLDPSRRAKMQPALVIAWLAVAKLYRSSEKGDGELGRIQALKLRDAAQGALEASLNTSWIDPSLAQAGWVLVNYENWTHPLHSLSRINSALALTESLIRALRLSYVDSTNYKTSVFRRNEIPSIPRSSIQYLGGGMPGCDCDSVSLAGLNPKECCFTPLWSTGPGWDPSWTDAEIKHEECRRLVWATHHAILRQTTFMMSLGLQPPEFALADPFFYSVLFEGESLLSTKYSNHPNEHFFTKESVWSLYARVSLIWGLCLRFRLGLIPGFNVLELGQEEYDARTAAFALDVWMETISIEGALNEHVCNAGSTYAMFAREYISNIRRIVTNEYTSNIPFPSTNIANIVFDQRLAHEWISNHIATANALLDGKLFAVDLPDNAEILSKKPVFQFWFSMQISRCLALWEDDPTLVSALELGKGLVAPMDYLVKVWPCPEREAQWIQLRKRLDDALEVVAATSMVQTHTPEWSPPCFPAL